MRDSISRRDIMKRLGAGSVAAAGFSAVTGTAAAAEDGFSLVEVTDRSKQNKLRAEVLSSELRKVTSKKLRTDWQTKMEVEDAEAYHLTQNDGDTFYLVTMPLSFRDRGKNNTKNKGDVTFKLRDGDISPARDGDIIRGYGIVRTLNDRGLDEEVTTYDVTADGITSTTNQVFDENGELNVRADSSRSVSASGDFTTQETALCTFCKGVGNVICAVGCGIAYSLIIASISLSPPAGVAAGAVVSAFCGLVTLFNDAVGGSGCGVDWTTERICRELYGCSVP